MTTFEHLTSTCESVAQVKRIIIETALAEAHAFSPLMRDVLVKYVSNLRRPSDIESACGHLNGTYKSALALLDRACGWYWFNVSASYMGVRLDDILRTSAYFPCEIYKYYLKSC